MPIYLGTTPVTLKLGAQNASVFLGGTNVSGSVASDPDFASVSLLMRFNGANESTTFTDSSSNSHPVTRAGNEAAVISTAQSKFGGASLRIPANGDWLSVPFDGDFDFPGDFTIEAWVRGDSPADGQAICAMYGGGEYPFLLYLITGAYVRFVMNDTSSVTSTTALSANTWHHVAVARDGSTVRLFVDGVEEGDVEYADELDSGDTQPLTIGRHMAGSPPSFVGYIDDLRITKGVARYTSTFTPPASQFPNL